MKMSKFWISLPLVLVIAGGCPPEGDPGVDAASNRPQQNFNHNWRFAKGEQPDDVTSIDFDDSGWQAVRLPHDWAIAGPFNPGEDGYAGKLPWKGVGWYRKTFSLDPAFAGQQVYIDFDGVMAFPKVYVNGKLAGEWDYGYAPFRVDATPFVKFGEQNVIAVQADTRAHGTRWYPGAGIYRNVTLTIDDPLHVARWSTYVTTPQINGREATVRLRTTIENHHRTETRAEVTVTLLASDRTEVANGSVAIPVPAAGSREIDQSFEVARPLFWDIDSPNLYTARVTIKHDGKTVDEEITRFGIRTFAFTADDGFHLNGRRVQLHGVNLHHDLGPLGTAFNRRAMQRQLEIIRDMGGNAIRTSHNIPAAELLDLTDEMGFIVWNEVFDKWDDKADRIQGRPPLEQYGEKQIRNFVMRDRNHPSVVLWSIGNEIGNQPWDKEGKSPERVKFMRDFVRRFDPTRPVGMACHIQATLDEPILDSLELTGWNYARRYARYRIEHPDKPIIYSESASALSTRGFYELPLPDSKTDYSDTFQLNSYDLNAAWWSDIPDVEFQLLEEDRFVAGEFVWTGFDYLGEPTPFSAKARSSYFGIIDLSGIPKDRFYLYRSHWRPDETTVHILPHWNWPDRIGQSIPVFVYTNGDSAELFLNGTSLGRRKKTDGRPAVENLALGKPLQTSSESPSDHHLTPFAADGSYATRWAPARGDDHPWVQVDLETIQPVRFLDIDFEQPVRNHEFRLQVSPNGRDWQTVETGDANAVRGSRLAREVNLQIRYLRLAFTAKPGQYIAVREIGVYAQPLDESPYYAVMDKYRLRWKNVLYEPGELRAVAYKNGKKIGQAEMRTAGKPAAIRLTPDRVELTANGDDLSFILVEATDRTGILNPLADNLVRFKVEGPAEIAAVGNGNPLSLEPFQADYRKLFYGKAILIVRSGEGKTGEIRITAIADGLEPGSAILQAR